MRETVRMACASLQLGATFEKSVRLPARPPSVGIFIYRDMILRAVNGISKALPYHSKSSERGGRRLEFSDNNNEGDMTEKRVLDFLGLAGKGATMDPE